MFFVGIDWSEQHYDVCVLDELGAQRATLRIPEGIVGAARFHELAEPASSRPPTLAGEAGGADSKHSPGAHAYYLAHRSRGHSHFRALYALANRWVGILHGCLATRTPYKESIAWPAPVATAAA
jgi:hypothetical protein